MFAQLGYMKSSEVKIVRNKHKVTFRVGQTVESLRILLANVPADAVVDEVIECVCDDNSIASIEFHEEKRAEN